MADRFQLDWEECDGVLCSGDDDLGLEASIYLIDGFGERRDIAAYARPQDGDYLLVEISAGILDATTQATTVDEARMQAEAWRHAIDAWNESMRKQAEERDARKGKVAHG